MGLIFLILSVSFAIFTKANLQHAVEEGVRYAITSQTMTGMGQDASIKQVVQNNSMGLLRSTNANLISIQYYTVDNTTGALTPTMSNLGGNIVEISVTNYTASPLLPILSWGSSASNTHPPLGLTVRASDRMEGSPGGIPPTR